MDLQQKQLDQLRQWLTATEDRISHMAETGSDYESVKQQVEQHKQLQQDLEQQQRVVDALSNMVVVVDENSPESGKFRNISFLFFNPSLVTRPNVTRSVAW